MSKQIFAKEPHEFILKLAEELKKTSSIKAPEWFQFVKSGVSKQRPPINPDFWYIRAASILRQLYIKGVVGVNRLRVRYGSKKNRGVQPSRFRKASGKAIRVLLQQTEAAGLIEKVTKDQHGRRLTIKGKELLDSIKTKEPEKVIQ
jgi:small subunit ribosomal protein S19e